MVYPARTSTRSDGGSEGGGGEGGVGGGDGGSEGGGGGGGGGAGGGEGGGGDGGGLGITVWATTVGTAKAVMPSPAEVRAMVPKAALSEASTAATVVEGGTAMVAVIFTLAAAMAMVTSDVSTLAALAILNCKATSE